LVLLLFSLLGYKAARKVVFTMAQTSEQHGFALVVLTCVAALPFIGIRYADVPQWLRAVLRGIGVVVLAQVLFDAFGAVPPDPNILFGEGGSHALFFRYGAMIGVAAGFASLWRPIFLLPLFYYYIAFRLLIGGVVGIHVTDTDYLSMLDAGSFAVIGSTVAVCATSGWMANRLPWLGNLLAETDAERIRERASGLVWAVVVGAHLGNYFCSGMAKLMAGGSAPWTWLVSNPTQTAIVIGLERGDNPLATFPTLLQFSWDAISEFGLAFNFFVLGAQLLSPLAILRVRWLLIFTLLFDVFHIGVFMTLGALFHFWIAVNLIIYSSAWRMRDSDITPMMKVVCMLTVLFGHFIFYTNWLGWLDGAKLASPNFVAVTRDGREVTVPSVYYGIYSYSIAQAWMYIPDDNFSFRIGGNNLNRGDWIDATTCGPRTESHQNTGVTFAAVENLVRGTHQFMQRYPAIKNYNLYYFYPHHMQPNPAVFREFNRLNIDDIVAYRYVVDSVCLSLRDGALVRDVKKHTEYTFDVR
jgi:hypothetical protein